MKATILKTAAAIITTAVIFTACKKETAPTPTTTTTGGGTYSSLGAFFKQYQPPVLSYTINGSTGGVFETSQGTIVSVPAGCFLDSHGNKVTGTVNVQFLDIYKKSDMLMSGILPVNNAGLIMNSGGEFFIKATYGGVPVALIGNNPITVRQPLNGFPQDKNMAALTILKSDSFPTNNTWTYDSAGMMSLYDSVNDYVFSLFRFNSPADSGTWCNSDNQTYFSAYTQVPFGINTTDSIGDGSNTDVFLLFNGVNSMVHVYYSGSGGSFPYSYAPQGLTCTVVAIEVDNKGKLRAAFVPLTTITASGSVNFTATVTTESAFTTTLATYNH